ncbi:nitrogen regulation protein NR(II) [Thermithiobacillus plumbiphilus]|uniref:Sensory histidine kinase/phosphatase NtrB n=1 Tax=Thermithiobacillus plumbiphilus TaxID=1729899 RepID=A0ABU9D745_9PROT
MTIPTPNESQPDFPVEAVLEALSTAILVVDERMRICYLNLAAEDLLKTSLRHSHGQRLSSLIEVSPVLRGQFQEVLHSQAPVTHRGQSLRVSHWGEILVDLYVSPLSLALPTASTGARVLIELVRQDWHLRVSQEEMLLTQHVATQEVVRGLAHEIKNPLGGLRGAAQLLERHLEDANLKEYTHIIIKEADRLSRLLTRLQGAQDRPRLAPCNIHHVLEYVRRLVQPELPTGIDLRFDYDPSIPEFPADAEQLIQVFLNLVRNAVQALGQEGRIFLRTRVVRQFTIGARRHRLAVCAEVEDNGPGIPIEMQSRIFLPLVTGRPDGMGLGLSIVQSLVAGHKGTVELKSEPGLTRFSVILPMQTEEPSA